MGWVSVRVLWFNWRDICNPGAGGAEVYTHEVARRLVGMGHEVTLFAAMFPGGEREEVVDGVRVVRDGGRYTVYLRAREHYGRRFRGEGYDVVVDEINTVPFFSPGFVDGGERVVALIHQLAREFWFYEVPFPLSHVGYRLEDRWLRGYVDVPTVTVSESTRADLLALGFRDVVVVHNGVNVEPLGEVPVKADHPVVVWVGRMKRAKRPGDVVEAFRVVRRRVPDAELWMVGDGYLRRRLESEAGSGVRFFGYVDGETRDDLVRRAWVIAVPGVREGWGQVVTDANALGTPAVGYDVSGLRDSIRDGFNGVLVENGPEALADGMMRVLSDDGLREDLSRNAIEWARRFSWDKTAEEFMKVLERTTNER